MYCTNCGAQINDNAEICVNCGVKVKKANSNNKDTNSLLLGVASCFFPMVGLILYFFWKDEKPAKAESLSMWIIVGVILKVLFWVFIVILLIVIASTSSTPSEYTPYHSTMQL